MSAQPSIAGVTLRRAAPRRRLGEVLVASGRVRPESIERALRLQQEQEPRERIGAILVKLGLISERELTEAIAIQLDLPLVERKDFPDSVHLDELVSPRFLKENRVLFLADDEDQVTVAMADPLDDYAREAIELVAGRPAAVCVALPSEIEIALDQRLSAAAGTAGGDEASAFGEASFQDDVEHLKEMASEAPVIKLVNMLMNQAAELGASDVHIEPFENRLKVRLRVDGLLREMESPPNQAAAAVISRVKIMANLNIAERRLPQDGRFKMRVRGSDVDLRVSTVPTMHGESVVMRLLRRDDITLELAPMGFTPELEQAVLGVLDLPHGILLVTGPTGSGKTTTLYAALRYLNTPERKILTVEDPVEYNLEGVNQIQVKPQIGLTFAGALRAIVRQDPDVVMVGEMRDQETAKIAVQSALTGHLVLSTLHTNDAPGSITRLLDMGVEDFLLTSTVNAVLAQRLVRRICPDCREPYIASPELVERWGMRRFVPDGAVTLYRGRGCEQCGGSGYRGRAAIVELLMMSEPVRALVLRHADASEITRQARADGMRTMFEDGVRKSLAGVTTVDEVLRVTQE